MKEFLLFLPLTVFYLALKSTLLPNFPAPDLPVVMIFYIAYRKASVEGAVFAFVLGYLEDAFSGGIIGSTAFSFVFIFIAVNTLSKKVHFSTPAVRAAGAGVCSLAKGVIIYIILRFTNYEAGFMGRILLQPAMTAIFAPAVIALLSRLTQYVTPHTFKDDVH